MIKTFAHFKIEDNSVGVANRLLSGEVDLALGNCTSICQQEIDFTLLLSGQFEWTIKNNEA